MVHMRRRHATVAASCQPLLRHCHGRYVRRARERISRPWLGLRRGSVDLFGANITPPLTPTGT